MEIARTLDPGAAAPEQVAPGRAAGHTNAEAWRHVAVSFEAAFLTEMLSHAGLGQTPSGFGGGAGEEAFASFLRREQARLLAESGAIGLAQAIEASLARAEGVSR